MLPKVSFYKHLQPIFFFHLGVHPCLLTCLVLVDRIQYSFHADTGKANDSACEVWGESGWPGDISPFAVAVLSLRLQLFY